MITIFNEDNRDYIITTDNEKFTDIKEALEWELKTNDWAKLFKIIGYNPIYKKRCWEEDKEFNDLITLAEHICCDSYCIYIGNKDTFSFIIALIYYWLCTTANEPLSISLTDYYTNYNASSTGTLFAVGEDCKLYLFSEIIEHLEKVIEDIEKSDYACLKRLKETLLKDCRKELDKLYEADRDLNKFIEDNVIKL